jgi:hypothetical protein
MINEFLIDGNIDWVFLRKQKQTLSEIITTGLDVSVATDLSGILHLLDAVQDKAVESGNWTEKEIFG